MIVPIHNHSEYSQIDGVSKPSEIAQRVIVEMGCPCCGLTDHGVVAGHLEFDKEIRKVGGKPLFGCELYHGLHFGQKKPKRDQAHLIAVAMTDEGLRNLWCMNDAAAQEDHFHHVGRVDWNILEKYKDGIVITSACVASLVNKGILHDDLSALDQYLEIFRDNFYLELSTYPGNAMFFDKDLDDPVSPADLNKRIVEIAHERGIGLVYGDDGHYAYPDQYKFHDAYVAKSMGDSIFTPIEDRKMWHPEGALCIKTEDDVRKALSYLSDSAVDEALANTVDIGERADAKLPEVRRHLPIFIPNDSPWVEKDKYADDEADLLFLDLVNEGMTGRYGGEPSERVVEQTAKEAEVFLDPEHTLYHYFLLAWDVMQFCDHAHEWLKDPKNFEALQLEMADEIPVQAIERGPGRGSSAGCIVAYELGITDIDPLPYDLIFERFWNPGRAKGFPDIDSDFEKTKRYLIKRYLTWRWGHDRVRSIGNVTRMKPKAVIETMYKSCGIMDSEANALKAMVEKTPDLEILGVDQIGWDREIDPGKVYYVMEEVGDEIVEWIAKQPEKRQKYLIDFLEVCETLCNRISNYGVHASGIVISDEDLPSIAPCRFAGSKEQRIPVTQFAMDDIDALMLIKFDALGLRTLDVLSDWKTQMREDYGIEIEWSGLEWEDHDQEMWELLWKKYCAGIFQKEEGMGAKLCEDMKPNSVADMSMIDAMNRPGPLRSGAAASIVKRRTGEEEIRYDDPFLEDLLDTTYGWFLYQEAVIRYFGKLGYSESDADAVRKILGKKQPEKWDALYKGLEEWEGKSYLEMAAKAGISKKNADIIWKKLVDFAKYSFNKSHSVAYGTVGFRTLFAKYNAPAAFYMACIRHVDKNKKAERIPAFVNEARRWGIHVHGPDIERSRVEVSLYDGDIYFGFDDIKGMSTIGAKYLVELRDEGIDLSSPEKLNEHKEALSKAWSKENARRKKEGLPPQEGKSPGQKLNVGHIETLYTAGAWERLEDYPTPMREMQEREKKTLSVILSDNTAEAFANAEEEIAACDLYAEAREPYPGHDVRFRLPGVVTHIKETKVKATGKKMGIVTIEYGGDTLEFAVFPDAWRSSKFLWVERTPGIFKIKHSMSKKTGRTGYHFEEGTRLT
jgi:DNA polymerase-3 subunit alpha